MDVAVLGASGNVGKQVLAYLLTEPTSIRTVHLLGRRKLSAADEPLTQDPRVHQHLVDFGAPLDAEFQAPAPTTDTSTAAASGAISTAAATVPTTTTPIQDALRDCRVLYIALGSGKSSQHSKEELMRVDCEIPVRVASIARRVGVSHCCFLSAVGSDVNATWSWLTKTSPAGGWYSHCKGLAEQRLQQLAFDSLVITHPATILGNTNTPAAVSMLVPLLHPFLPNKFVSVHARDLAAAMAWASLKVAAPATTSAVTAGGTGVLPFVLHLEGNSLFAMAKEAKARIAPDAGTASSSSGAAS